MTDPLTPHRLSRLHRWALAWCLLATASFFQLLPASLEGVTVGPVIAWAEEESEAAPDTSESRRKGERRVYYGGNIGLSIYGGITHIVVQPLIGYRLTPKVSLGAKVSYEYLSDRRSSPDVSSHNYGGGAFSRYHFTRQAFAHLEFSATSFDLVDGRTTVPFLLIGGGYARPLGPGVYLVFEVLVDLIQDKDSPYRRGEPRVNVGINAGF